MIKITEAENLKFYHVYGISEWFEKCLLLDDIARNKIIDDLENGNFYSPLVQLAKLPFPHFVTTYLKTFNKNAKVLNDPSFGYKLYFLEPLEMRFAFEKIKNPDLTFEEIFDYLQTCKIKSLSTDKMKHFFKISLEDIVKNFSAFGPSNLIVKKWIYISQYIDAREAERLQLRGFEFFDQGEYKSNKLNNKLNLLNEPGRQLISDYLGLNGKIRRTANDLSKEYNISLEVLLNYIKTFIPLLMRSLEEMQCSLDIENHSMYEGKTREYRNEKIKWLDIKLNTKYYASKQMSQEELEVFKKLPIQKKYIYVAKKYMFQNDLQVSEYLNVLLEQIAGVKTI